jgi:hypothetical protein
LNFSFCESRFLLSATFRRFATSSPTKSVLGQEDRGTKRKAGGVEVALDAAELEGLSEADLSFVPRSSCPKTGAFVACCVTPDTSYTRSDPMKPRIRDSGLETPSGMASVTSTVPGGLETPDFLELRKRREETERRTPDRTP